MREACDTGMPPMRALWLHYPEDDEAVKLGSEFLWGRDMLVAPVVEKGATSRRLYLPASDWYDWWTGEKLAGKRWIEKAVDLATTPLYVRAGGIIPLDPVRQYTSQQVTDPTTIKVYPGADGQFVMYDDDGQSLGYRDGSDPKIVWIRFRWNDATKTLTIEPDARMKQWPAGSVRVFDVTSGSGSKRVEFKGEAVEVNF
jgi:alpha-glucosidase/alpha-D-xyloside xylohydrolase